jgi:hypothetical protein
MACITDPEPKNAVRDITTACTLGEVSGEAPRTLGTSQGGTPRISQANDSDRDRSGRYGGAVALNQHQEPVTAGPLLADPDQKRSRRRALPPDDFRKAFFWKVDKQAAIR